MDLHPSAWPAEFICPISRSVMADPVIVSCGHTYERRCIETWLDRGQQTCLKDNNPLDLSCMISNIALKDSIDSLARSKGIKVFPVVPSPSVSRALVDRVLSELQASKHRDLVKEETEVGALCENIETLGHGHGYAGSFEYRDNGSSDGHDHESSRMDSMESQTIESAGYLRFDNSNTSSGNRRIKESNPTAVVYQTADESKESAEPRRLNKNMANAARYRRVDGYQTSPMVSHMYSHSSSGCSEDLAQLELPPYFATKPAAYYSPSDSPSQSPIHSSSSPAINVLIQRLQDSDEQEDAIVEVRQLSRASAESRVSLCSPEMVKAILLLLGSENPNIQINAAAVLVNLSIEKQNKVGIVRAGAVPYLVDVLKKGFPEAQEHSAGAIFSLALADENKNPIGVLNAIPPLISLLHSGPPGSRQDAAMALYHLSLIQTNKSKLVRLGAVPVLLKLAESQDRVDLASRSLLILGNVVSIPEGRSSLLEMNAITRLVKLLNLQNNSKTTDIPEQAAAVLLLLLKGNVRLKSMALQAGVQDLLISLVDGGTPRAREKANALLAIMKDTLSESGDQSEDSILARQYIRRNLTKTDAMQMNSSAF